VAGILQPVDQDDHLARRRIDEADVRRIEPACGQRTYCHRLVLAERDDVERLLALACIFRRAVPDADVICTLEPFLVLGGEPDHGAALRAHEIIGGNADGPAETRGHADDLVGGVNRARPADLRDGLHVLDAGEHLDARDRRLQTEQAVEIGDHGDEVELFRYLLLHGAVSLWMQAIVVSTGETGKAISPLGSSLRVNEAVDLLPPSLAELPRTRRRMPSSQ